MEKIVLADIATAEVVAGGKALAGATYEHDLYRWIGIAGLQGMQEFPTQLMVECVSLLGPIEGNSEYANSRLIDQRYRVAILASELPCRPVLCKGLNHFCSASLRSPVLRFPSIPKAESF